MRVSGQWVNEKRLMTPTSSLAEVLDRPDVWRGDCLAGAGRAHLPVLSSGFALLDAELPGGGWPRGSLVEVLADPTGLGECSLLLPVLTHLQAAGRWLLLVAPPHAPHGPAWARAGIDLARMVVVAPALAPASTSSHQRDALWAMEQALASGAPGAVLCWTQRVDARQVRRLQVAASGGDTLAVLFRPLRARGESSPAVLRLALSAGPDGMLAVDLFKRRGAPCVHPLHLAVSRPHRPHCPLWRRENELANTSASALAGPVSAEARARSPRFVVVT